MPETKNEKMVPFYSIEGALYLQEKTIKRLWITCILLIILLVGSNALWLWYESQWEYVETTTQEVRQDIDTRDGETVVIGIGDNYGKDKTNSKGYNN